MATEMPGATPISHWIGFHLFILVLLGMELVYARRQDPAQTHSKTHSTSVAATILWVAAALAFALFLLHTMGSQSTTQYLAGYAIEESLSIDNLFVFLILFRVFNIEPSHQPKVLFWGVAGAIVLRGAFIAAGLGLLARFEWISYAFAAILLIAAIRLVLPSAQKVGTTPRWITWLTRVHPVSLRQDKFFVRELVGEDSRPMITVLFLALLAIELTDVIFALDSIPAVLSITRNPFLAYTSNIMAVMGLRSLYFLLAHLLAKLRFLHYGLAAVLAFAALKMLSAHWLDIGPLTSLATVLVILGITIALSLIYSTKSESTKSEVPHP
jgi:tellurite resistance protein TerC